MLNLISCAGCALAIALLALPANATMTTPEVRAQKSCDTDWIWSETLKKCVRVPRGSYEGS